MSSTLESYREQITRTAQALAVARNEEINSDLAPGMSVSLVKMFTDGNLDKRFSKLQDACELLADGFSDLDDQIAEYVKAVPLAAYDTGSFDAERFLEWIDERHELTDEQRDLVECQKSRHAVEFAAVRQRLGHVRFQELLSLNPLSLVNLSTDSHVTVHLNPIHVFSTFETRVLLEESDTVPAHVLFFPVGIDIRTAVLEEDAHELLLILQRSGSIPLCEILELCESDEQSMAIELIRDLATLGIVALA